MSKGSTDDITRRKRTMITEALKTVNAMDNNKPRAKPERENSITRRSSENEKVSES